MFDFGKLFDWLIDFLFIPLELFQFKLVMIFVMIFGILSAPFLLGFAYFDLRYEDCNSDRFVWKCKTEGCYSNIVENYQLFYTELLQNRHFRAPRYLESEKKVMDSAQNASSAAGTGGSGGNGSVSNDTSALTSVDDSKQNVNQVINSIQKTMGIHQLPLLQRLYAQFFFS